MEQAGGLSPEEQILRTIADEVEADQQRRQALYDRGRRLFNEFLESGFLRHRWYAREDDLIGSWCIMLVDEPPSRGVPAIGNFMDQATAEHVAMLHNEWLD